MREVVLADFDVQTLKERLKAWLWNDETLDKILPHAQGRMDVMSDFIPMSAYLLSGEGPVTADAFDGTADSPEELLKRLQFVLWRLEAQQDLGAWGVVCHTERPSRRFGIKA